MAEVGGQFSERCSISEVQLNCVRQLSFEGRHGVHVQCCSAAVPRVGCKLQLRAPPQGESCRCSEGVGLKATEAP